MDGMWDADMLSQQKIAGCLTPVFLVLGF